VHRGGVVEPANRAAVAKERFQAPRELAGARYELRDPFAEVTYRVKSLDQMVAKAEQLGARRFYAVNEEGQRTAVVKVGNSWKRSDAPLPSHSLDTARIATAPMPVPPAPAKTSEVDILGIDAAAERVARTERLEAELAERYVMKRAAVKLGDVTLGQTEYRYRGDMSRVAFTETTFRLATDTNSPSVARSMVDVAQARNWQALRISGHEDFKRLVWLEASVRGVKTLGYEPQRADIELLKRERDARQVNRIEQMPGHMSSPASVADGKQSARGSGGRKAVLVALEAVLVAKRVPRKQRDAVMAAAAENLAKRVLAGEIHKVKVYDRAAAPQRPVLRPTPEHLRAREPAARVR
jgi:hypothetical protein